MAIIKKNPNLPDYFVEIPGVSVHTPTHEIPSIVSQYEDAKALYFPDLRPSIDFDFWAKLDTNSLPALKKLSTTPSITTAPEVDAADQIKRIERSGVDPAIAQTISQHMSSLLDQVLPVYRKLFEGYRFTKGQVVWRLNEICAENLHVDTYREALPHHFARMFINLDNQPRIWHTSWQADKVVELASQRVSMTSLSDLSDNDLWTEMNRSVFGKTSREWWDDQPRHIGFFEPGDVWVVDSRLVAHQIFYGRRAVSIDFFVEPESMLNPSRHYLELAREARRKLVSTPMSKILFRIKHFWTKSISRLIG